TINGFTSCQFKPPLPAPSGGMAMDFTWLSIKKRRKSCKPVLIHSSSDGLRQCCLVGKLTIHFGPNKSCDSVINMRPVCTLFALQAAAYSFMFCGKRSL